MSARLVEVKDQVQLAHVAKELVEQLDEEVDRLKVKQLVVAHVHAQCEEEAGVPSVNELVLSVLRRRGERTARCLGGAAQTLHFCGSKQSPRQSL